MGCKNCQRGTCTYHTFSKLRTGLQYSKEFQVYDLRSNSFEKIRVRSNKKRKRLPVIEMEEKTATCTKCRVMTTTTNYFITTRSGSANVCICHNCSKIQFANQNELFSYIKNKLSRRYMGSDSEMIRYLSGS